MAVIKRPASLKQSVRKRPSAATRSKPATSVIVGNPVSRLRLKSKTEVVDKCCSLKTSSFRGERLHAVQIGLGTFGTVPENLVGTFRQWENCIAWLLKATSETRPELFRGVVVEPVPEHIDRVRKLAPELPHMRFAQAAISDEDLKSVELHAVTEATNKELVLSVSEEKQKALEAELVYVRNMSSVGGPHPFIGDLRVKIFDRYGVDVLDCVKTIHTDVWSYSKLAQQFDFCGCEVLAVDTEGHDAKIIRSMIQHCKEQESNGKSAWPDVIAFETCGICDEKEGTGTEAATVVQLEQLGYFVFLKHKMNTDMIRRKALSRSKRLQHWLDDLVCSSCQTNKHWPITLIRGEEQYCHHCISRRSTYRDLWQNNTRIVLVQSGTKITATYPDEDRKWRPAHGKVRGKNIELWGQTAKFVADGQIKWPNGNVWVPRDTF